jgi:ferrous iron transport protein B
VTSFSSVDERIARDYILSGEADLVVNIVDASNLERNLYLTTQLLEMRVPMVVALNMIDMARERRIEIDFERLQERLGCAVVPLVANRGEGVEHLKAVIGEAARERRVPKVDLAYLPELEEAIAELEPLVSSHASACNLDPRWVAIKLLEEDDKIVRLLGDVADEVLTEQLRAVAGKAGEDVDILIADGRYGFANALIREAVRRTGVVRRTISDRIDRVVLNRMLGIPIFLVVTYLMFLFTINLGGAFIDFFDRLVGTVLVDGFGVLLADLGSPAWLIAVLAGGVGGGIQTVATFIPVIGFLYLFLSFLEDSGYMARAAFVMDRFMRSVGLPGKSFIPLIVGFGCNVPAIMATRTLEHRRDRVLTVMMAPFMSCGARLPVYALFAAAFFPTGGQNVVFALYLIGIAFAVMTGLVLKRTILPGEITPFIMELPPYHLPTLKGIVLRTWDRLQTFLFNAGKAIVAVVVVLSFLNSMGTDGSFGNENTDRSVLAAIGKSITPAVEPMGIHEDNWPATVGLFTGIFAKEAVVGTLNTLYGALGSADEQPGAGDDKALDLWDGIVDAFATIPANLVALANAITDPLGLSIVESPDIAAAARQQGVAVGTFGAMASRFDGKLGAFAYLLAVLLYIPCVAAVAAIYRETGGGWAVFASLWTTGLGYGAAVLTYQAGTFAAHPGSSGAWIGGVVAAFVAVLTALYYVGTREQPQHMTIAAE